MATQVKLYIEPDQEIRRFNLDASATFQDLRQRVEGLVGHSNFRILWLDTEKDFIVLGSADELAAAKEVLTNNLLRLFVRPSAAKSSGEKKVHRGVTCDGCQGTLAGSRFKCLECADYDLCEACQGKGVHQEHDFLLIRAPRSSEWKKLFAQGYGTREGILAAEQGACGARRHCGMNRGPGHHHRGGPGFGPFGAGPLGAGPFGGYCGPFGGPPGAGPSATAGPSCGSGRRQRMCEEFARRSAAGGEGFVPPLLRPFMQQHGGAAAEGDKTVEMDLDLNRPVADIIADVTKRVMGAINKAQNGGSDAQNVSPYQPETEEKKADQEEADAVVAAVNALAETVSVVSDVVTEFVEELSKAESENGWTHLEAEQVEDGQKTPEEKKPVVETATQDKKTMKDQRIESALRAMEEMGFPTEGLLLRRLLETYNGDIARVLDSIK